MVMLLLIDIQLLVSIFQKGGFSNSVMAISAMVT
jgi:hypothetical protein